MVLQHLVRTCWAEQDIRQELAPLAIYHTQRFSTINAPYTALISKGLRCSARATYVIATPLLTRILHSNTAQVNDYRFNQSRSTSRYLRMRGSIRYLCSHLLSMKSNKFPLEPLSPSLEC